MSDRIDGSQYAKRLVDYMAAYNPADNWQRSSFLKRLRAELARLAYMQVSKAEALETLDPMIMVHASFLLTKRAADMVQVDLGTVWTDLTMASQRAAHTFLDTADGFFGRYLCVTQDVFMTVDMRVVATR
jgi:hypothetical protein